MKTPEEYRIRHGRFGSNVSYGNNGAFEIPLGKQKAFVIASDGEGWEHVSVSFPKRSPTWEQMCHIKALFWDEEATVIQYHPAKTAYVNNHPHCLHLWKPCESDVPMPPRILVGI